MRQKEPPRTLIFSKNLIYFVIYFFISILNSYAEESILNYSVDIGVEKNSELNITENITVYAEGNKIRRGIYRDFPTQYLNHFGHKFNVGFKILSIQKDGLTENYHTEKMSNGIRIYIGSKDVFLSPGTYTYTLKFKTDRQIGFFDDHDELYFNAIGNGWEFPVKNGQVRISLPETINHTSIKLDGYTGAFGAKDKDFTIYKSPNENLINFKLTKGLLPHEGFTVLVGFEKGKIDAPSKFQKMKYFLRDNRNIFIGLLGFIAALIYYLVAWYYFGRDPQKGAIFPQWEIPQGITAPEARYINKMGYDKKTFTSFLLQMAIKGLIKIKYSEFSGKYSLERDDAGTAPGPLEDLIRKQFFKFSNTLEIDTHNHEELKEASDLLEQSLKEQHLKKTFYSNIEFLFPALFIMFLTFFIEWYLEGYNANGLFSFGVFLVFFAFVVLHFLFRYLLKAPTIAGRKLLDRIEGLKMYMSVAERDSLTKLKNLDEMPKIYERFLPYAIALGVENKWAEKFASAFNLLSEQGRPYYPTWYNGYSSHNGVFDTSSFNSGFSSSFTSTISSSSVPPGSSSGFSGGGGSSGGGGGGGGGGGW